MFFKYGNYHIIEMEGVIKMFIRFEFILSTILSIIAINHLVFIYKISLELISTVIFSYVLGQWFLTFFCSMDPNCPKNNFHGPPVVSIDTTSDDESLNPC